MLVLPTIKQTGKKAAAEIIQPWRPDFREVSALPDTKTIRTSFFINLIAGALAAAITLYVLQFEWTKFSTEKQLAEIEIRIADTRTAHDKVQALFKDYLAEQKKFSEIQAIAQDSFLLSDFVKHLGAILPEGIYFKRIEYKPATKTITANGSAQGLDANATTRASKFEKTLQDDPRLAGLFSTIRLTSAARNIQESALDIEFLFTFKDNSAKPKPTK